MAFSLFDEALQQCNKTFICIFYCCKSINDVIVVKIIMIK